MLQRWSKGLRSVFDPISSRNVRAATSTLATLLLHEPQPLVYPPSGFGVLWSAKSGSKAITYWFLGRQGLLDQAEAYPNRPREAVRDMGHQDKWLASCDPLSLNWLRVIRNPYFRAVSSYRHALRHGYEDKQIEHVMKFSIENRGLSFSEFLDYLLKIDIATCNKHHAQQCHPIEAHVPLRKVINIDSETLTVGLESFEKQIGLEPLAPHAQARLLGEWERDSKRFHKRLEADIGAHTHTRFRREETRGAWPSYEAFLSSDTRRKIEQIYAKDFMAYVHFL